MDASRAGDVSTVRDLMTDDVVFLVPGRPPMHAEEFAAASGAQAGAAAPVRRPADRKSRCSATGRSCDALRVVATFGRFAAGRAHADDSAERAAV